ncbi:bacteriohemerythrin [Magnetospirillum sp. SS-4]|uniref:bacteriohemerythrin n=1 Tax=Magnetospirillum sp. SS-4 TaxID=2681465 RepID=UPI0015748745|nr:hemerythrin domain-containing protein [Magnetospirillum sp. SS-4]
MCLGVPALDDDHRRLVVLLDQVCLALQGRNLPGAGRAVEEFIDALGLHFAHEERLIDQFGGDADERHRDGHAETLGLVERLREAIIDAADHALAITLASDLITQWITRLFHHDSDLVRHLKAPSSAGEPATPAAQPAERPMTRPRIS